MVIALIFIYLSGTSATVANNSITENNANIMITNCLKNRIAQGGNLKPTIFTAILNLYEKGLLSITAQDVRIECENINKTVPWGNRLAAICNTMKNAIECGGVIVCEDKNNNFKISFDGQFDNSVSTNLQITPKVPINKGKTSLTSENEFIELSKNFKVVMICAGSKVSNSELKLNGQNINFKAQTNRANNEFLPDDLINIEETSTWRDFVVKNQKIIPFMAYELYTPNEYRLLNQRFGNRFFILSAGWGLIRADFKLPKYDITFSGSANRENRRQYNRIQPRYNDFNQLNDINNEDIVFIGGKDYLLLFYKLTQNLPSRKIVYYYGTLSVIRNDKYIYKRFNPKNPENKRSWHYELAGKIANGIIP